MSALDYLKEYRVVKVHLPLQDGGSLTLDGVAKTTRDPQFEITFLPDQLNSEQLNDEEICQVIFDVAGATQSVQAKITEVLGDAKLQLEMREAQVHTQKRAYFRVEAGLSVRYWRLDDESAEDQSLQTAINISGGGMRLPVEEPLEPGTRLGLEINVDAPAPRLIECAGAVVRRFECEQSGWQVALSFVDIEQEDQDAIVAYCLAEQRKQLRLKVQVLGS